MTTLFVRLRAVGLALFAGVLVLGAVRTAHADTVYTVTLPADGTSVGPITISLTLTDFVEDGSGVGAALSSPWVSLTSPDNTLNLRMSTIGFHQSGTELDLSLNLKDTTGNHVLLTNGMDPYFFSLTPGQTGDFSSTGGALTSSYTLANADPTLQLSITSTPEPASWALMATGFLAVGMVARRRWMSRAAIAG